MCVKEFPFCKKMQYIMDSLKRPTSPGWAGGGETPQASQIYLNMHYITYMNIYILLNME